MSKIPLLLVLFVAGCALNPYASDFSCPEGYRGKCISVNGAYGESRKNLDGPGLGHHDRACSSPACRREAGVSEGSDLNSGEESRSRSAYRVSLYDRLGRLLREPRAPVVAPPKVLRVLLLPYKGQDGELYMMRHVYFFADEPRWLMAEGMESQDD